MQGHSNINSANESFSTQAGKIESLLRSRYGQWIPAYQLADVALQYCARLHSIRKKLRNAGDSEVIQNKTERIRGQVHGSYRICQNDASEPVKTESRHSRAVQFEREFNVRPSAPAAATSDLPLFPWSSL
jgi:hypothetical protein